MGRISVRWWFRPRPATFPREIRNAFGSDCLERYGSCSHPDDGRLLIDDSKKVNDGPGGLAKLEAGVSALASL